MSTSTVTVALSDESLVLTALIVTEFGFGSAAGAEYMPDALIVPVVASPPAMSLTDQVTSLFGAPVTVAENDCEAPMRTFAPAGEMATPGFDPPPEPPEDPLLPLLAVPQPAMKIVDRPAHRTTSARVKFGGFLAGRILFWLFIDCSKRPG